MDGLDAQASKPCLHMDKAQSTDRHPPRVFKNLNQFVIFGGLSQLLLNHPEHLCRDALERILVAILNAQVILDSFPQSAIQAVGRQSTSLGEQLPSRDGHFGERDGSR